MTPDDVLAYLASKPKRERPTELRSDSAMLAAWLAMREDRQFLDDVVCRHGLHGCYAIEEGDSLHEHAISNAWGHCMAYLIREAKGKAKQ